MKNLLNNIKYIIKESFKKKIVKYLLIILLAMFVRFMYFVYNESLNLPNYWFIMARWGVVTSLSDFGRIPIDYDSYHFAKEDIQLIWNGGDRGILYPHVLFKSIFGTTSFKHLQILQLFIDSLMVILIILIGKKIGNKLIGYISGISYAIFLPQIYLAANPSYDTWLSFGFIILSYLFLLYFDVKLKKWPIFILGLLILFVLVVINEIRSVILLYPFVFIIWIILVYLLFLKNKGYFKIFIFRVIGLIIICFSLVIFFSSINFLIRGDFVPVRSSYGHEFWVGVGQFSNPYGIKPEDGDIARFYEEETGKKDTSNTAGIEYNKWLVRRAKQFIIEEPFLYSSMVIRRALLIFFLPKLSCYLIADRASFNQQQSQIEWEGKKNQIINKYGNFSIKTYIEFYKINPSYIIYIFFTFSLSILMCLGVCLSFIFSKNKYKNALIFGPMFYILAVFSFYRITSIIIISTYAALLSMVISGYYYTIFFIKKKINLYKIKKKI